MGILSKKIVSNSLWMVIEKCISIFGLIFVTSFVAKHIGPENFGKIAFVNSIFIIVQTVTWFGNQEIAFKRISRNAKSGLIFLASTQKIRKIIFCFIAIPILLTFFIFSDRLTFIFGIATALSVFFLTQDYYVAYNNAMLKSYINALSNSFGLITALILRYLIVNFDLPIEFLSLPIVVVSLLPLILRKYFFNKGDRANLINSKKYTIYYLVAGFGLLLSNLAVSFYTQINNFLLVFLGSLSDLGVFNVAVTLGMSWIFINNAIITSIYSKIYNEKDDFEAIKMVCRLSVLVVFISLTVFLGLFVFGKFFINLLYGSKYELSYNLMLVIVVAGLLSSLGTIYSRFIIRMGGYQFISKKMFTVALCSIPISYLMINQFGMSGATYSMVVVELISLTLLNYLYQNGLIFKMHFFFFYKEKLKSAINKV